MISKNKIRKCFRREATARTKGQAFCIVDSAQYIVDWARNTGMPIYGC
jgi:hypothetical protein